MVRQLLATSAVGLALAVATPAMGQNYGSGQSWGQQPRYDNNYGQQNAPYGQNQYGNPGYQQPRDQGYRPRDDNRGYGSNTQDSAYGDRRDRNDRREGRQRSQQDLAQDIDTALQAHGYDVGQIDGKLDSKSRAAIRAYERDANLPVTGQPSQQLLAHIEANNVRPGGGGSIGSTVDRFLNQQLGK